LNGKENMPSSIATIRRDTERDDLISYAGSGPADGFAGDPKPTSLREYFDLDKQDRIAHSQFLLTEHQALLQREKKTESFFLGE
jgi:hypothetical protein